MMRGNGKAYNKKVNATTGEFLAMTGPSRAVARYLNRWALRGSA